MICEGCVGSVKRVLGKLDGASPVPARARPCIETRSHQLKPEGRIYTRMYAAALVRSTMATARCLLHSWGCHPGNLFVYGGS